MKKYVVASTLALTLSVGLATSPKTEASSTTKYYFKQYKTVRKYKHGIKAIFGYRLPQLKGNSAAIKKINKSLRKNYTGELKQKKELFKFAKWDSKHVGTHITYDDIVKPRATYNKNGVISFRYDHDYNIGGSGTYFIGSWTYSLKTGKQLTVFDVAEGDEYSIVSQLYEGAVELGADDEYLNTTYPSKMNYTLKGGKVYVYPRIDAADNRKYFVISSRYK
ncbi:hypothetical protein lacNasYZ03_00260 [Lactobacillus nasalidis]|uniref:Uncharacterized protein n=1 Tax=Lactobacillus nasalidis TaxID=2797258 RepID=A0ABQ3W5H4_9LACO|nr:DUF4163 domain-containing protein [Lactobacillus nasalidis]GHV98512.1 hypothetical protein lacNasYZ01_16940 [Lactobacillus nasalidis]GHW00007.1 hypothetical protein lacNasYZ02_14360 [Lactobacillus nasalidis]GHW00339.1 hypothetical protein lacNasYZ03_00260 [Lactobacillus nasalidis]